MNKIINWTLGSFFRTVGRILVYIILGILLSYLLKDIKLPKIDIFQLLDVYAYEIQTGSPDRVDDLKNVEFFNDNKLQGFSRIAIYNCSSNSTCNGNINYYQYSGGTVFTGTMANYGFDIAHDTNFIIKNGHIYSYSYTICFQNNVSNLSNRIWVNSGLGSARGNEQTLLFYDYYHIGGSVDWYDYSYDSTNVQSNSCYTIYNLFKNNGGDTTNIKVNLKTSSFSNKYINVVGYRLEDLGTSDYLTQSQLQSTINNSGLASASSVSQVQNSVNQVKTELNNVNNSIEEQTQQQQENHEETINTITDDNPPDNLNSLSNSAGWLPAGPVDSILNLPLNFLNSLFNNLSKTCTPVKLPLPYVNKELELPCVNSLYAQIDGVPTWINTTVGLIASAFILFSYLIRLYKYIDDTLTFRENNFIDNWSGV